jgi:DNA-3-methyladenine glycosylase I
VRFPRLATSVDATRVAHRRLPVCDHHGQSQRIVDNTLRVKTRIAVTVARSKPVAVPLRCPWCGDDPVYIDYHDREWGFPVVDDRRLFEKICLEGFQSGLSWRTILNKRESFREAFANFEFEQVAHFNARDEARLLANAGIVRHRGKIAATINNARRAIELRDECGSLAAYFWRFEPPPAARGAKSTKNAQVLPSTTAESVTLSKDLKKRGWSFVGPTTMYAFMQAMGLVNDHVGECHVRPLVEKARTKLVRPR